jgi:hypothetical protein
MSSTYRHYIKSQEWYGKHKRLLKESGYRCSMFLVPCGKGKPYRIHHLPQGYKNGNEQGWENLDEKLWEDVIVLCPFAHDFIIHGVLSGFKSAGKQWGGYPNILQNIVHAWCCTPLIGKLALIGVCLMSLL